MSRHPADVIRWDARVARARHLAERYPAAADILTFYAALAEYQKSLLVRTSSAALTREQVVATIPEFLAWLERRAPPAIADAAARLRRLNEGDWQRVVDESTLRPLRDGGTGNSASVTCSTPGFRSQGEGSAAARNFRLPVDRAQGTTSNVEGAKAEATRDRFSGSEPGSHGMDFSTSEAGCDGMDFSSSEGGRHEPDEDDVRDEYASFIIDAIVQPFAERAAIMHREDHSVQPDPSSPEPAASQRCPRCRALPVVGVLREEGHGARRSLVCARCLTEWEYLRVFCPSCGEHRFDALPVYAAEQFAHVRVEACDSCRRYLKTIDLTRDGHAVPIVDDFASLPLDLWAREQGYARICANLLRT